MSCQTLPNDVAMNTGCIYGSSSSLDQIYRLLSREGLSSDFAENSRVLFGNHTLLCELIKKRAKEKPSFLQRDLRYKIQAKQNKRIQITISLSGSSNTVQAQNIFPLYALIAKPVSTILYKGHSPVYQFTRACLLTCFDESGRNSHTEATFIIEDLKTLANIILVSCGKFGQSPDENNCSKNQLENSSLRKLGGQCFWGKIPNDLLHSSLENCVDLSLGRTKKFALPVTMSPGFGETKYLEQDSFLTFCSLKFNSVVRSCLFLCYCIHLIFIALYDKNIVDGVQLPTKLLAVFLLICLSFVISVSISTRSKHTRTNHWCKIHV